MAKKKSKSEEKYVVELKGDKEQLVEIFDSVGVSGREIDANMKRKHLFGEGFVIEAADDTVTFFAGNELAGFAALMQDTKDASKISIDKEGIAYCKDVDAFIDRLKGCADGKVRITMNESKIEFVDSENHKSGFKQVTKSGDNGGEARIDAWKGTVEKYLRKMPESGIYTFSEEEPDVIMVIPAEEMNKIVDSAQITGVTEYPIEIKGGKVNFSVESEDSWDSRELTPKQLTPAEVEYTGSFHTGIDAAFSALSGDVTITIVTSEQLDVMTINSKGTVFFLTSKSKEAHEDEDEESPVEEEPEDEEEEPSPEVIEEMHKESVATEGADEDDEIFDLGNETETGTENDFDEPEGEDE